MVAAERSLSKQLQWVFMKNAWVPTAHGCSLKLRLRKYDNDKQWSDMSPLLRVLLRMPLYRLRCFRWETAWLSSPLDHRIYICASPVELLTKSTWRRSGEHNISNTFGTILVAFLWEEVLARKHQFFECRHSYNLHKVHSRCTVEWVTTSWSHHNEPHMQINISAGDDASRVSVQHGAAE